MIRSHNNTLNNNEIDLIKFFTEPVCKRQKQYEVVRAVIIEKLSVEFAAKKFGYKINTVYSLIRDSKSGQIQLFPEIKKGPKHRKTSIEIQERIIRFRKENLSSPDIHNRLKDEHIEVSARTIERILTDAGFRRLKRRTNKELGKTNKDKIIPKRSESLNSVWKNSFNILIILVVIMHL
jgi:transposase